jgi:hypothetical protein
MKPDELFDAEDFDPKKLFDESQYSTFLVNRDGFTKKQNDSADLVNSLASKYLPRTEQEEIFAKLKELKAQDMLIEAIKTSANNGRKARLIAACWESGLDMSQNFLFFTRLACDNNFEVAMEALTVITSTDAKIDENILTSAIEIAQNTKSPNTVLVEDLIENLRNRNV